MHLLIAVKTVSLAGLRNIVSTASEYLVKEYFLEPF